MPQNIVEYIREEAVKSLFSMGGFRNSWTTWLNDIRYLAPTYTNRNLFDLGDNLSSIFLSTTPNGTHTQSGVSTGGNSWEGMICWYLNLCLIGRRTVVIKHNKKLLPEPISDAITVKYGTSPSNTESDLIAITFPNMPEYTCDKDNIIIQDNAGNTVPCYKSARSKYNLLEIINALTDRDFSQIEIHVIQCKTNWNDNSQVPMLWDAVYAANSFHNNRISVGNNGYAIAGCSRFTYSFATVPTNTRTRFTPSSVAVLRVKNLSGGNYWGRATTNGVAASMKEMLSRNLGSGHTLGILDTMRNELPNLSTNYAYFRL